MKRRDKNNKLLIGIVIIFLMLVSVFAFFMFYNSSRNSIFLTTFLDNPSNEDTIFLDFCTTEYDCLNYLNLQGMPDGFLESKGYSIYCQNGECYFKKI
jgi:hypothetical protein